MTTLAQKGAITNEQGACSKDAALNYSVISKLAKQPHGEERKVEIENKSNIPKTKLNILARTNLVRYADKFLIITSQEESLKNSIFHVKNFLRERGLSINEEKSSILK